MNPNNESENLPTDGVRRRTIVQGAAWTIPVVAAATAVPGASASPVVLESLVFNQSSYTWGACTALSNVSVIATASGAPAAGIPVTVQLPSGYTFAGGATSFSGTTSATGVLPLPDITAPGIFSPGNIIATGGGLTAASSLSTTSDGLSNMLRQNAGGVDSFVANLPGATEVKADANDTVTASFVRDAAGNVYNFDNGELLASNVVDFEPVPDINDDAPGAVEGFRYITTSGQLRQWAGGVDTFVATVPGATQIKSDANSSGANRFVRDAAGNVYNFNNGELWVSNAIDFAPSRDINGFRYITANGQLRQINGSQVDTFVANLPGAIEVKVDSDNSQTNRFVRDANGNVYNFNSGELAASNVVDFAPSRDINGFRYITANGQLRQWANGVDTFVANVPGATEIKTDSNGSGTNRYVRDAAGNVYDFNNGQLVASNVVDFAPSRDINGFRYITGDISCA